MMTNNYIFSCLQDHTKTSMNNYATHCHFFDPAKPHHNDNEQCSCLQYFFHDCKTTPKQQRITLLIVIFSFLQKYTTTTMSNVIVCCHFFTLTKQHKRMMSWAHCHPLCSRRVEEDDDDNAPLYSRRVEEDGDDSACHCCLLHNRRP